MFDALVKGTWSCLMPWSKVVVIFEALVKGNGHAWSLVQG